jgi:hypothetical protein
MTIHATHVGFLDTQLTILEERLLEGVTGGKAEYYRKGGVDFVKFGPHIFSVEEDGRLVHQY